MKQGMIKKVVIFDMDGVLLNSEPYYFKYLNKKFTQLNLSVTREEYDGFVGLPSRKVWTYLENTRGINLGIEDLMRHEEEEINSIFQQAPITHIQGVKDLLESLHSLEVKMNVASSSYRSTIELIIDRLGFDEYFKFLLSGTEVANGKPHPDIFLKSAELHNVKPSDCIVIEDSNNGLKGANKAGMISVGFRNPGSGQQDLSEADIVIDDFQKKSIQSILDLLNV